MAKEVFSTFTPTVNSYTRYLYLYEELMRLGYKINTYNRNSDSFEKLERDLEKNKVIFHINPVSFGQYLLDDYVLKEYNQSCEEKIIDTNIIIGLGVGDNKHGLDYIYSLMEKAQIPQIPKYNPNDIDDFSTPKVFKKKGSSQGEEVYLIENKDQYEKLKAFNRGDLSNFICSKYIQTPSNRYTHIRVFTMYDRILGSVLSYSEKEKKENVVEINLDNELDNPSSPYFLARKPIVSNFSAGGNQIVLNPNKNSKKPNSLEKRILKEHGIVNQRLPEEIEEFAKYTGEFFGNLGLLCQGQDWIVDNERNFYCLEVNYMPQYNIFNNVYNMGKGSFEDVKRIGSKIIAESLDDLIKKRGYY